MKRPRWRSSGDLRLLRRVVAGHHWRLLGLALLTFVGGLLEALFLLTVTRVALGVANGETSIGVPGGHDLSTGSALGIASGLIVLRVTTSIGSVQLSTGLRERVSLTFRRRLANAFLGASWSTQQRETPGRLQELLVRYVGSAVNVIDAATMALGSGLNLLALLAMSIVVDPLASVTVVAALVILGSVLTPLRRRVRGRSAVSARAGTAFSTSVSEFGALGLEMQVFGVRAELAERIDGLAIEDARTSRRLGLLTGLMTPVYVTLAYLALLGALAAVSVIGIGELASLGAVLLMMLRSLSYGQSFQSALTSLVSAAPVLGVYYETVAGYEADPASGGDVRIDHVGEMALDAVGFAYSAGAPVLRDIDMRIEPGEIVGVIGPSGAGKSTLVQVLLGLRSPTEGAVLVDGVDLRRIARTDWTRLVAFVPQNPQLFQGTIAENIALFRSTLGPSDIERAAERAHLDREIDAMPLGYETLVGPRGTRLSGGQQQRLCIARALAGDPQVLVLDEPTSSLDPRSESLICETLGSLRGHSTVVVIAHRMSTLSVCDRIAVIQDGRLAAFDTPQGLQAADGFYREALTLSGIES